MSQRKIPESSFSEQHDESDDKSKRKWVIKWNTVTHHGKIRIKMERWLDPMTWLDEEWGTASRLCVSHSESIAKLGWVVLEMSIKSSERWCVNRWCCTTNLDAPYPSSLTSHSSLSFPPLVSPSHLASIRTVEQILKDFPTNVASASLLDQVMIECLEG